MQELPTQAWFEEAQLKWPTVKLAYERFARTLERDEEGHSPAAQPACPLDLYLATACLERDTEALRIVESTYLSRIPIYIRRFSLARHLVDEVMQSVRVKQLAGARPGLAAFRGRGSLAGWLRISAIRTALEIVEHRDGPGYAEPLDLLDALASSEDGPELAALKKSSEQHVRGALEQMIASLAPREKTLLRLQVVDRLSIDGIAAIYHVHRATVARWLVSVRRKILEGLRRHLEERGILVGNELDSMVRLLGSRLQLSAERLLATV